MITIAGASYVQIRLDGFELPPTVSLRVVRVHSMIDQALPTFDLVINDSLRVLDDRVVEGALIEMLVSKNKEDTSEWMPFRIFSFKRKSQSSAGVEYSIHGYYDFKNYLYNRVSKAFNGNSSDVVSQIAAEGGLKAVVDSTSENANWYCANKSLANFLKQDILPASSRMDTGFMMSVIDARTKSWYYRDVNDVVRNNLVISKLVNSSLVARNEYHGFFSQYRYDNSSGYDNVLGYSMKNARYNAVTGQSAQDAEISAFKTDSKLSMNNDVPEKSYVMYTPIDFGNNGDGPKNRGTNARQRSLWSVRAEVLLTQFTSFDLLTLHQLDFIDSDIGKDKRMSGVYVCIGRTIAATQTDYKEALTFLRNAENVDNTQLK